MKPSQFEVHHPNRVPYYSLLSGYDWVTKYLKYMAKLKEIRPIEAERKRIQGLVCSKADFLELLRESHEKLKNLRKERLTKFLVGQWASKNANVLINYWSQNITPSGYTIPNVPDLAELESAIAEIPFPDTISEIERKKILSKLDRQVEKLEDDLPALCPEKFCTKDNAGVVLTDRRREFVNFWVGTQQTIRGACGPMGLTLDKSPSREKKAWKDLKLDRHVPQFGRFTPHPGTGIRESLLLKENALPAAGQAILKALNTPRVHARGSAL